MEEMINHVKGKGKLSRDCLEGTCPGICPGEMFGSHGVNIIKSSKKCGA